MPYILITNGVTGSGKSKLITETIKYYDLENVYTTVLIDDLVENHPTYKQFVREIMKDVAEKCNNDPKCIKSNYTNPTDELLDKFNNAYYTVRKSPHCVLGNAATCDEYNDKKLRDALLQNKNVVFETQGLVIPNWLIDGYVPSEYRVIFSYSLVSLEKIVNRNIRRILKSIELFNSNSNATAPRLPDVRKHVLEEKITGIINTMQYLLRSCMRSGTVKTRCPKRKIDNIVIFDNDASSHVKIFDSSDIHKLSYKKLDSLLRKYVLTTKKVGAKTV